jgi:hypothetical protein
MLYIERKPALPLRRSVRSLWYASTSFVEHRRERILPSGCAHIVVSLSQDFLTDCPENRPEQRTAPALMVGQRSVYEIVATADLVDLAGVLFMPGAVPAFVGDRADLISNRNLPLDEIWSATQISCAAACLRVLLRSIKSAAEQQNLAARLARMPV